MSFSELMNRLGALEAKMAQMLRVCTVVSVQDGKGTVRAEPMSLVHGDEKLTLRFDCKPCEMHVVGKIPFRLVLIQFGI